MEVEEVQDGIPIENISINMLEIKNLSFSYENNRVLNNVNAKICKNENIEQEYLNEIILDSGLKEFVEKYSLEFIVGDNGSMISGGENQKIALARALIRNRPIIIFDEATSNMDLISEKQIIQLVNNRLKETIVIFITHRKALLKIADKIFALENGELKHKKL